MLAAVVLALACAPPQGADPRYELGWRLKALEPLWITHADVLERAPLLARWRTASYGFFSGRTDLAARALDEARGELLGAVPPWSDALALVPAARLVDVECAELGLELTNVYESVRPARFELRVLGADGRPRWKTEIARLPWSGTLPLEPMRPGAQRLVLEFVDGATLVGRRELRFSAAAELEGRLEQLSATLAALSARPVTLALASARGLHDVLEQQSSDNTGETDLPGAELLAQAEACVAVASAASTWPEAALPGERHLWVPVGDARVPVRLCVPGRDDTHAALPLVIALHGAGGSENLFFEGYGAGAIVPLCAARGWLLVAPRISLDQPFAVPALVAELARFLPIERGRVFLVGHSLGAMLATAAINSAPSEFCALALLGGAGKPRALENWKELPVFLGTGQHDFALPMVAELEQALRTNGARRVSYHVYPATEHVTVVGAALADAFAFFDASAH